LYRKFTIDTYSEVRAQVSPNCQWSQSNMCFVAKCLELKIKFSAARCAVGCMSRIDVLTYQLCFNYVLCRYCFNVCNRFRNSFVVLKWFRKRHGYLPRNWNGVLVLKNRLPTKNVWMVWYYISQKIRGSTLPSVPVQKYICIYIIYDVQFWILRFFFPIMLQ
jgi:hypothetical protein